MKEYQIDIGEGGHKRIKNAAMRINKTIYLVGSRAAGTHHSYSDFDYIIPTIRSKEWTKIKNSLPGAKIPQDNLPNRIDLLKVSLDLTKPYIRINP
jgi:predicted nucleotidyltransferase